MLSWNFDCVMLDPVVHGRIAAPGIAAEIRSYFWPSEEPVEQVQDHYWFTRNLSARGPEDQTRWKLPKSDRFLKWGDFGLNPARVPVQFRRRVGEIRTFVCEVDPELFARITGLCGDWYDEQVLTVINRRSTLTAQIINRMVREVAAPGFASEVLIEGLGASLLVEFSRLVRDGAAPGRKPGLSPRQLALIRTAVQETPAADLSVASLAAACRISARHLMRGFKAATGLTVHQYVTEVRLQRARALLETTRLPLKAIAAELGFSSPSHFSAAFAKSLGVAPSAYREQMDGRGA
jgi:AraC family transcriptional regulator